jgi:hypothetical protein
VSLIESWGTCPRRLAKLPPISPRGLDEVYREEQIVSQKFVSGRMCILVQEAVQHPVLACNHGIDKRDGLKWWLANEQRLRRRSREHLVRAAEGYVPSSGFEDEQSKECSPCVGPGTKILVGSGDLIGSYQRGVSPDR